jgi:hypothetical protein
LQYIEIEYNQELKPLEAVLSGVKQPGDFFVCGAMEMPMPRVEVEGVRERRIAEAEDLASNNHHPGIVRRVRTQRRVIGGYAITGFLLRSIATATGHRFGILR